MINNSGSYAVDRGFVSLDLSCSSCLVVSLR